MVAVKSRSDIDKVEFIVYGRPLHPEIIVPLATKVERHGGAELTVDITDSGHRLQWRCKGAALTELVGIPQIALPKVGRTARHHVSDSRDVEHSLASGFGYYAASHAESVPEDIFAQLDRELQMDAHQATLAYDFSSRNRLQVPARSLITMEFMDDSLVMHAVHTFPSATTIVRTQSLFELP